jgi:tetratricopeptide (TPR) repeat protein/predicted aspartyl protease
MLLFKMKPHATLFSVLTALVLSVPAADALAKCTLGKMAEVPVIMNSLRPTIAAKINGTDETFVVDSGAFYSTLTAAAAAELKLHLYPPPYDIHMLGVGGATEISIARVKTLAIFNVQLLNVEFIVGGSEAGNDVAGLLGQNFLRIGDVEYDLANGVIRLMHPDDCGKTMLAYWANSKPVSIMDINWATPSEPHTTGVGYLNGARIRVVFDSGADTSFVSLQAAARAGIKPGDPGVESAGVVHGFGPRPVNSWIAPFASFKIGDEEIRNTRLRIGDFGLPFGEMLIGADFFLSHHIYVASSQHKLYFTYNGGPVFNLKISPEAAKAPDESQPMKEKDNADDPTDAAGFSRRGTASAARHDFEHAIADLTRACELDPNEPSYFYERGVARRDSGQSALAMTDFDQAIKLKADDVPTLVARAELRLRNGDAPGARSDLDAAQNAAPKEADVRFRIGVLYGRAGELDAAVAQLDLWIAAHTEDSRRADALGDRCLARALLAQELDKALSDCNAALRLRSDNPNFTDSRALVQLRLGHLDKAIADWDAVVKAQPKNAWALYGRGVAKLRKGKTSEGQADIAAATAIQPRIGELGKTRKVTPP